MLCLMSKCKKNILFFVSQVRDKLEFTRAFIVDPVYLQHAHSEQVIDPRHWGLPLSRRFRSLKLWFTIRR